MELRNRIRSIELTAALMFLTIDANSHLYFPLAVCYNDQFILLAIRYIYMKYKHQILRQLNLDFADRKKNRYSRYYNTLFTRHATEF